MPLLLNFLNPLPFREFPSSSRARYHFCLVSVAPFSLKRHSLPPKSSFQLQAHNTPGEPTEESTKPKHQEHEPVSVVKVWTEKAEDWFVDPEENLEDGEVCHLAIKAFALGSKNDTQGKIFLCAGALVERLHESCDLWRIFDLWIADAILSSGGPNLQIQGSLKVLEELYEAFLEISGENRSKTGFLEKTDRLVHDEASRHRDIWQERTRDAATGTEAIIRVKRKDVCVVQCGTESSAFHFASHHAAIIKGFRPIRHFAENDSQFSIYEKHLLDILDDGMLLDPSLALKSEKKLEADQL